MGFISVRAGNGWSGGEQSEIVAVSLAVTLWEEW